MRDLSRKARVLLAAGVVGVLGSGMAAALTVPAPAHATSSVASAAPAASGSILQVCLTVREIHFGPKCVAV